MRSTEFDLKLEDAEWPSSESAKLAIWRSLVRSRVFTNSGLSGMRRLRAVADAREPSSCNRALGSPVYIFCPTAARKIETEFQGAGRPAKKKRGRGSMPGKLGFEKQKVTELLKDF